MKKTDRDKDWPIVGGLAAQTFARGEPSAVLHLRDASMLIRAWAEIPVADRAKAIAARPLLGGLDAGCEELRLEFLLRVERIVREAVNRRRYAVYQHAWKAWYRRWQVTADWPWLISEPFAAQHERIVKADWARLPRRMREAELTLLHRSYETASLRRPQVQEILDREFGKTFSLPGIYKFLQWHGIVCLKPRPRQFRQDPAAPKVFKRRARFLRTECGLPSRARRFASGFRTRHGSGQQER